MSHFLVTGGAGFIGSHLTDRLLAQGHAVRVLDDLSTGKRGNLPPDAELVLADVADPDAVIHAMVGMDGCFHLAAIASVQRGNENWLGTNRVNLVGTIAVLDAARARSQRHVPVPVVYASSAAVYGDLQGATASETLLPRPMTAYGADKLASELHAAIAWQVHGVPTFGLRFFNVYGSRQDPHSPYSGVISIFAERIGAGLPVTLHGDGGQTRDFVHVADVAAHLTAAMAALVGQPGAPVTNVCTGQETAILSLAAEIGRCRGIDPVIRHGAARPGDIRRSVGDPCHARALLGEAATTTLRDGLAELLGASRSASRRGGAGRMLAEFAAPGGD